MDDLAAAEKMRLGAAADGTEKMRLGAAADVL
jgi:hypothetical protein